MSDYIKNMNDKEFDDLIGSCLREAIDEEIAALANDPEYREKNKGNSGLCNEDRS